MKKITFCEVCGTQTKFGGKTCSRLCGDSLKKSNNRELRKCKVCKKDFEVKKTIKKEMCSDECRKIWNAIPENKEHRMNMTYEAVEKKYGVKSTLQLESAREKTKQTKKEKYGDENYVNSNLAKQTKKKKYGDENYNNHEKNLLTKKEKYGNENYNNRDKAHNTMEEKYGVHHAMQLEEFQKKAIKTNLEKFGTEHAAQNEEIKKKTKQTNREKYGVDFPSQLEDNKNKVRDWFYEQFPSSVIFETMKINNISLLDEYKGLRSDGSYKQYNFQCLQCNNVFLGTFSNNRPPVCRGCYPTTQNNKYQIELREFFISLGVRFEENIRKIINPLELDFYLPEQNIALELNGNYYHSEIGGEKDKNYHLNKSKLCLNKKIKLIHIFEDEWLKNKEIIKSRIKNLLRKTDNTIYARKCEAKIIENDHEKISFLELNHIQGNSNDTIRIGLYYEEKLVSLMTFIKLRKGLGNSKNRNDFYELTRFCSIINTNVIGGFNKLLNFFLKKYNPKYITTFADCRWSGLDFKNTLYHKCGFSFIKTNPPRYWYLKRNDYLNRFHRFSFNKNKLLKLHNDPSKTEWELAQLLNMDRIWDCGNMKFEIMF